MPSVLESFWTEKQVIAMEYIFYKLLILGIVILMVRVIMPINPFFLIPQMYLVYLAILTAGLYFILKRNFYLPFLGRTVYPCEQDMDVEESRPANWDIRKEIKTTPKSKVIYWAAKSNKKHYDTPEEAYGKFPNKGVTRSDNKGNATLYVKKPSGYTVNRFGFNKELEPHIHYRICLGGGLLSQVKTSYV